VKRGDAIARLCIHGRSSEASEAERWRAGDEENKTVGAS
jgi:hypothetical protein